MDFNKLVRREENRYAMAGMPMGFRHYVFAALLLAAACGAAFGAATGSPSAGGIAAAAIVLLAVALPARQRTARLDALEENLPDALRHLAIVLRTGGTVESAMEETAQADYGPLSERFGAALAYMRRGKPFEDALGDSAAASGSRTFQRTVSIISDAKRSGAGLADAVAAIAEDAAELQRIRRERVSRTTTHVIFLYTSAVALAPFIFGFTLAVVAVIGNGMGCAVPGSAPFSTEPVSEMLALLVAIEAGMAVLAASAIRYGSMSRQAAYAPIMILTALAIYEVGKLVGMAIIGGGGACS